MGQSVQQNGYWKRHHEHVEDKVLCPEWSTPSAATPMPTLSTITGRHTPGRRKIPARTRSSLSVTDAEFGAEFPISGLGRLGSEVRTYLAAWVREPGRT